MDSLEKEFVFQKDDEMTPLCSLKNMNLTFGTKCLFRDASLTINAGDRIGLLGTNGQGKSSLFKVIRGDIIPGDSERQFIFDKYQGDGDPEKAFSVFLVPQELPEKENPNLRVKDYFFLFYPYLQKPMQEMRVEEVERLGGWNLLQNFESYLRYWGLSDFEQKVHLMSGGEQKRILLSLGLSAKNTLILWDEPTNHLDIESIERFEDELQQANHAFMLVTHDRYLLSKVCNKIFHLRNGKIELFEGSYAQYLEFLQEKEVDRLRLLDKLKNTMRRETDWIRRGVKARRTKSKKRIEDYDQLSKTVREIKEQAKKELDLRLAHSERKSKKLVELKDVHFTYSDTDTDNEADKKFALKGINLSLHKGDKVGLIGGNGSGKTTLINLIVGSLSAQAGEIKTADQLQIQLFSQKRHELKDEMTPYQLLGDGQDTVILPDGRSQHVVSYFEKFMFSKDELHRPLKTFSGGEKNRLQMAMNLKRAGDLWIFDEPTNDLDLETLQILEERLQQFNGALILISHDRSFLENVTNKVWVIEKNEVMAFEAGYGQAVEYLEALKWEEDLRQEGQMAITADKTGPSNKISNKDKMRLKELPNIISQLEKRLQELELILSSFSFDQVDHEKLKEYQSSHDEKENIENSLLNLYEELDNLTLKNKF